MLLHKDDFMERYGIDHVVIAGHPNSDKDSVVPAFTLCEVVLGLSWEDPRVHFVATSKKGEEYYKDRFYHTGLRKYIYFTNENQAEKEEEILPARSPRRAARSVIASGSSRSGVVCNSGDDDEEEKELKPIAIDRSRVLTVNVDTGKKSLPLSDEELQAGRRVFYYDHHPAKIDLSDLDVKHIVFVCLRSLLDNDSSVNIKRGLIGRFEIETGPIELKFDNTELPAAVETGLIELRFVDEGDPVPSSDDKTLVLCINTESKFFPFSREAFKNGTRIFYYSDWSAAGLVFRTHEDCFKRSRYYEHFKLMTMITEANDYGKKFDAKNEYELGVFFQLAKLLNGLNYNQVKPRDHARTLKAAFLAIESFLSNRIMFERNLEEVRKGCFKKLHGVRMFVHDFTNTGMSGETVRRFLQGPPYIEGKEPVDCIITVSFDRMQIAVCNRELKAPEYLDTSEIKTRILQQFPELVDLIYKDDRGFLLSFKSDQVSLEDLERIMIRFMDERKEKLIGFTSGVLIWRDKILGKMSEISKIDNPNKRSLTWKAFYQNIPDELQPLADKIFFGGISFDEEEVGGESTEF